MLRISSVAAVLTLTLHAAAAMAGNSPCSKTIIISPESLNHPAIYSHKNIAIGKWPALYGMVITNNSGTDQQNEIAFAVNLSNSCVYELWVEYAALQKRPVHIGLNGEQITADGLNSTTGGWGVRHQKWEYQCDLEMGPGQNIFGFYRTSVFPSIRAVKLTPKGH